MTSKEKENLPQHISSAANEAYLSLLPPKSKLKYDQAYKQFNDWKSVNRVTEISEDCLLAFFYEKVSSSFTFQSLFCYKYYFSCLITVLRFLRQKCGKHRRYGRIIRN